MLRPLLIFARVFSAIAYSIASGFFPPVLSSTLKSPQSDHSKLDNKV